MISSLDRERSRDQDTAAGEIRLTVLIKLGSVSLSVLVRLRSVLVSWEEGRVVLLAWLLLMIV